MSHYCQLWSRFNQFCLICFKQTVNITTANMLYNLVPLSTKNLEQRDLFMEFLSELKLDIGTIDVSCNLINLYVMTTPCGEQLLV